MSVRRLDPNQPESFEFTQANASWADETIAKYPKGKQRSAVIPLLWRAQEQNDGWLSEPAIRYVADKLDMAHIRVFEIATFYTMFQLSPVGKRAHVQVCGTTPCMLRGAEDLVRICKRRIAPEPHTLSEDGDFSWEEVECLGACVNAPMVQIWSDTFEDLTPQSFEALLDGFAQGNPPKPGPQVDRQLSAPSSGPTTLTDPALYNRASGDSAATPAPSAPADLQTPIAGAAPSDADLALEAAEVEAKLAALAPEATAEQKADAVGRRPIGLSGPRGGSADDLKRIKGIGRVNEDKLNELGIFHFDQIANWDRPEVLWVGTYLAFPGRIDREDWLAQARALAAGGDTEFSRRVDAGEVASSREEEEG